MRYKQFSFEIVSIVFGVIVNIATVFTFPLSHFILVAALTIMSIFTIIYLRRKNRLYETAIEDILDDLRGYQKYTVKPVSTEDEFNQVWDFDISQFGDSAVSRKLGLSWWNKFPTGIYIIIDNKNHHDLMGYISFWPLTKEAFRGIVTGKKVESQITVDDIKPPTIGQHETFWHIGSIVVVKQFRRGKIVKHLICGATAQWLSGIPPTRRVNISAVGFSEKGRKLLSTFFFDSKLGKEEAPNHYPVYVRSATAWELLKDVARL